MAHESGIEEMQPRALAQALAKTLVVRPDHSDQKRDLQSMQPCAGRRLRDAGIGGKIAQIQFLPRPGRSQAQKRIESRQIGHAQDVAKIALDIGATIVSQPGLRRQILIVDAWIETRPDRRPQ